MIEALQHRPKETQWERDLISNGPPRSFERKSQSQWYIFLQPTPRRCQVISEPIIPAFIQADNGFKTKFYTFFFRVISPNMRHCHRDFYSIFSKLWGVHSPKAPNTLLLKLPCPSVRPSVRLSVTKFWRHHIWPPVKANLCVLSTAPTGVLTAGTASQHR